MDIVRGECNHGVAISRRFLLRVFQSWRLVRTEGSVFFSVAKRPAIPCFLLADIVSLIQTSSTDSMCRYRVESVNQGDHGR